MANDRWLALEGVHNFRDFGGYATVGGGRVRHGRLWRSGQHYGASEADLAVLDELGLELVADLRGNSERASHPCRRSPGFAGQVVFHDGETTNTPPHERTGNTMNDAGAARERMLAVYRRLPFNPAMIDVFQLYFTALAASDGASLVHCFAGKDRTGVAVALVHELLGVHRDDALADYMLTNSASTRHILHEQAIAHAPERWNAAPPEVVDALLGVDPSYLAASFGRIADECGSVDAYFDRVLGVDAARRTAIRTLLVE